MVTRGIRSGTIPGQVWNLARRDWLPPSISTIRAAICLRFEPTNNADMRSSPARDIDSYIARFPADVQKVLQRIRTCIRKAAPGAEEVISYQMPAFKLHGTLIFFAAYKNFVSLYPAPRGAKEFKKELSAYKGGKGTVQFPLDEPIPFGLITRIVKYRAGQNLEAAKAKQLKKKR